MSKAFDIELFLSGVLTESHFAGRYHLPHTKAIQAALTNCWHKDNPWTWQRKHIDWFMNQHLHQHAGSTLYYYLLTLHLLAIRFVRPWQFKALDADRHKRASGKV